MTKSKLNMEIELHEVMDDVVHKRIVGVKVEYVMGGLLVTPENYSSYDGQGGKDQSIIMLEVHNGRLELVVWADRDNVEPTHVIDLEGARQESMQ